VGLDFISLRPFLERAAKEGDLLYYQLDAHWNSKGREIAAAFVADVLKSNYLSLSDKQN
jgi:SGNH hydrolase-like domain, acetyltransferase AlgX